MLKIKRGLKAQKKQAFACFLLILILLEIIHGEISSPVGFINPCHY
ncbi:protein of unknown function (plasmid) [Streptococcus thermophilus]|nr:protein of unknown function [Streptococcus thermophilus]